MKDQHQSLSNQQMSAAGVSTPAAGARRHHQALSRTHAIWRRRAGAAIPLLLAIATAVALG